MVKLPAKSEREEEDLLLGVKDDENEDRSAAAHLGNGKGHLHCQSSRTCKPSAAIIVVLESENDWICSQCCPVLVNRLDGALEGPGRGTVEELKLCMHQDPKFHTSCGPGCL